MGSAHVRRHLKAIWVACVFALLMTGSARLSANACTSGPSGEHTRILCNGEGMTGDGNYLESPNREYRMYISDGNIAVYQGNTFLYVYADVHDDIRQWRMQNGYPIGINNQGDDTIWSDAAFGYTIGTFEAEYIAMDDDGCMRSYDSSDNPLFAFCG